MAKKRGEKGFLDERVIKAIQERGEQVLTQEEIDAIVEAIKAGTFFLDDRVAQAIKVKNERVLTQEEIDAIVEAIKAGKFTIKK
jgi:flagellar motor switch protein FliM